MCRYCFVGDSREVGFWLLIRLSLTVDMADGIAKLACLRFFESFIGSCM